MMICCCFRTVVEIGARGWRNLRGVDERTMRVWANSVRQNGVLWWNRPISALSAELNGHLASGPWLPAWIKLRFTATKEASLNIAENTCNSAGIALLSSAEKKTDLHCYYLLGKSSEKSVVWWVVFGKCFSVYTGWAARRVWSTRLWCQAKTTLYFPLKVS